MNATTITMPQLGETVTEGTVAQWLKRVGDAVEKYEAFVEISTDKVNAEVPSPVSGVLARIIVEAGETVATGAPIAIIEEAVVAAPGNAAATGVTGRQADASPAASTATRSAESASRAREAVPTPGAVDRRAHEPAAENGVAALPAGYGAPGGTSGDLASLRNGHGAPAAAGAAAEQTRRMSPAVRRLAREHRVDVATLRGSGSDGRVTAQDVLAARAAVATVAFPVAPHRPLPAVASGAPGGRSTYAAPIPGTLVPLTPARKLIAQRMTESLATAPHAWTMVEVDVTKLVAWRAREKERFLRDRGAPLTLLPFFIAAVVQALRAHPLLNSRYTDDGIVVERGVHVGIAIGLDSNLVVPVIRDADALSIGGLAVAAGRLIERARNGKLTAEELGGGTFTVNNTGANGSVLSKPIINAGQAAIVTMESVVKRAVVIDDAIAIRAMMNVCLSLDHRVLDGTSASAFLNDLRARLEAMDASGSL